MLAVDAPIADRRRCRSGSWRALNEAVIEKQESGHTVRLLVRIDGAPFTTYAADGLIVATPTGSTAYSLSARGPVVSPRHRALLLTPVSPHMLFDRSLVLDPDEAIEIEVVGHRSADLNVDGQRAVTLGAGQRRALQRRPTSRPASCASGPAGSTRSSRPSSACRTADADSSCLVRDLGRDRRGPARCSGRA